jgi:phage tail sheath gpL-like
MTVVVPGLSSARKTPGFYINTAFGGVPTAASEVPRRIVILANKITTTLTNSAPSFSVTAGTLAAATPTQIYSADDALTYAGQGSEAHLMAKRIFEQMPDADVSLCLVAEAGSAATGVLTFATTATSAFTVRFRLDGKTIDVAVASGDTATVIATACANALLDEPDLPLTAQFAVGALTLTAKNTGLRGNNLVVDAAFVDGNGRETRIGTSGTSSSGATTGIWTGVTTTESTFTLSGGATQDTLTAALAALTSTTYHRYVAASIDGTALDALVAHLNSLAGVLTQRRSQAIVCSPAASGTAITLATGRNAELLQIVWHYNSPLAPPEVAAQVCAMRLAGDSAAGGTLVGEAQDPGANLDGCILASVPPQQFAAEQPTATEIESALNNGLTPLVPASAGRTAVVRSITTRSLANGQPNYSVLDTSTVTIGHYVADDLQADLATVFRGKKIRADSANGAPPRAPNVVTPSIIRGRIAFKLFQYQDDLGIIENVDAYLPNLVVAMSATAGRVDCEIPFDPGNGLHIIGANLRQVAA